MEDIERNGLTDKSSPQVISNKSMQNGHTKPDRVSVSKLDNIDTTAPDGGTRAWLVMLGSFFCNGILFGVINSYGVLYTEILSNLLKAGVTEASSKAALVGSLTIGTTFCVSPIAGILTDKIGLRRTTLIGGVLAALGMFLSSFITNNVEALYVTYGIMYGLGAALAYTPSLAILGHYFHKYLGFVNGIVTAGSSVFTVVMPFVIEEVVRSSGLNHTLWVLAALAACIMLCAMLFKPLPSRVKPKQKMLTFKGMINVSIWKNKRYVIWASVIPIALFGYFVPYVHMKKFVEETFPNSDGKLPVVCIGITSGIGRLIFGYIADLPRIDRVMLQQLSFLAIGLSTMFLPFCKSFPWLLVITLVMGLFDGCFIALLGPIAFDICGQDGATQAIGFLLGLCSIPLTFGPPIAGMIYDHTGSYELPMLLAGIPPVVGFIAMFLIRCVKMPPSSDCSREPLTQPETVRQPQIVTSISETAMNGGGPQAKLASAGKLTTNHALSQEARLWEHKKQYGTMVL